MFSNTLKTNFMWKNGMLLFIHLWIGLILVIYYKILYSIYFCHLLSIYDLITQAACRNVLYESWKKIILPISFKIFDRWNICVFVAFSWTTLSHCQIYTYKILCHRESYFNPSLSCDIDQCQTFRIVTPSIG